MKTRTAIALASLIAAGFAFSANAQTAIYRCGNAYGTKACEGSSTVEPVAPAKASDVEASRRETDREMKVATAMEKARIAEDAKAFHATLPKQANQPIATDEPDMITAKKGKSTKTAKAKKAKAPKAMKSSKATKKLKKAAA